jgi:shikimate kinase
MPTGHTYPRHMVSQLLQQLESLNNSAAITPEHNENES